MTAGLKRRYVVSVPVAVSTVGVVAECPGQHRGGEEAEGGDDAEVDGGGEAAHVRRRGDTAGVLLEILQQCVVLQHGVPSGGAHGVAVAKAELSMTSDGGVMRSDVSKESKSTTW